MHPSGGLGTCSSFQVGGYQIFVLAFSGNAMENVKKCKNFLSTLIKLAGSQPAETIRNVKDLIQVYKTK